MDRRQRKTDGAIRLALTRLLERKSYAAITVRDIIDEADIGRTTFYAHFDTKDDLLRAMCASLFDHVFSSLDRTANERSGSDPFLHILQHLGRNDHGIRTLLAGDTTGTALAFFHDGVERLVTDELAEAGPVGWQEVGCNRRAGDGGVTERQGGDRSEREVTAGQRRVATTYLIDHLARGYVNTVLWWMRRSMEPSPEEVARLYRQVSEPVIRSCAQGER